MESWNELNWLATKKYGFLEFLMFRNVPLYEYMYTADRLESLGHYKFYLHGKLFWLS